MSPKRMASSENLDTLLPLGGILVALIELLRTRKGTLRPCRGATFDVGGSDAAAPSDVLKAPLIFRQGTPYPGDGVHDTHPADKIVSEFV